MSDEFSLGGSGFGKGRGKGLPLMLLMKMLEEMMNQQNEEGNEMDAEEDFKQKEADLINPELDQEILSFEKNGIHTTVIITFKPDGYPASAVFKIGDGPEEGLTATTKEEILRRKIKEAVEKEDYKAAAEFTAELEQLKKSKG